MAEGTRLNNLTEHLYLLEEKMQELTSDYHGKVGELTNQIAEIKETEQRRYESLQVDASKRHEFVLRDNAHKHEELRRLLSAPPSTSQIEAKTERVLLMIIIINQELAIPVLSVGTIRDKDCYPLQTEIQILRRKRIGGKRVAARVPTTIIYHIPS